MPKTNQSPALEHPAVRAAREIAHRFVSITESPSRRSSWWRVDLKGNTTYTPYYGSQWEKANDLCENLRSVVADAVTESLRAYADRDARVLKALEGVAYLCCADPKRRPLPNPEGYREKWELADCGKCTACKVRAAIDELKGEGQ